VTVLRVLAVAALACVLLAGCGGGSNDGGSAAPTEELQPAVPDHGDAAAGKSVFEASGCGGCHTLAAAGANGSIGPNLDDADVTYAQAYAQIEGGGGGMPSFGDQLSRQEIANVAQFVVDERSG
jgi:mono/diheme cytochrome c family protein